MINNTYLTKRLIGRGGSANVFLVENSSGENFVAKVIKDREEYTEEHSKLLVRRETEIMNYLSGHPNILQNYEVLFDSIAELGNGVKETINCTILELAKKGTLSTLSTKIGKMEEFASSFLFSQMLGAIGYMHSLNIVHCDIKPQNILLDEYYNVKISDFGVSQIVRSQNGNITKRRGTKGFMAPELEPLQREDEYDPKCSDIYALGATLLYITCGEKNFSKLT